MMRKVESEKDLVQTLILRMKEKGFHVQKNSRMRFGAVDLVAWNSKQILIFEVKYVVHEYFTACFHDLLQGLGQLLSYREQFPLRKLRKELQGLPVRYILYSNGEIEFDPHYIFLKGLCAKYDVTLWMPYVNHVRISEDHIEIKDGL